MLSKFSLAAGLWVAITTGLAMAASPVSAPQILPDEGAKRGDALVHQSQSGYRREKYQYGRFWGYYSRCHYRRRECARRWGRGTRRYRTCLYWQFCRFR
jgi:hypothetical protein